MTRRSLTFGALAGVTALVLAFPGASAAADAKHACVTAAHDGQQLRDTGKLSSSREAFLRCSAEACPTVVRESCQRWAAEVEPLVPSIVFAARDRAGTDLADVRVTVDGVVLTRSLDGRSLPVDPGPHELTFEADGFAPARQSVIVREGEKARSVSAVLTRSAEVAAAPAPPRPSAAPPARNLTPLFVTGAVSAVGLSAFAVFGLWGASDKDHLSETCAPSKACAPSDVSAAQTKLVVADVGLIVGAASAAIFTGYLLAPLLTKSAPASAKGPARAPARSAASFGLGPTTGGAFGTFAVAY